MKYLVEYTNNYGRALSENGFKNQAYLGNTKWGPMYAFDQYNINRAEKLTLSQALILFKTISEIPNLLNPKIIVYE